MCTRPRLTLKVYSRNGNNAMDETIYQKLVQPVFGTLGFGLGRSVRDILFWTERKWEEKAIGSNVIFF